MNNNIINIILYILSILVIILKSSVSISDNNNDKGNGGPIDGITEMDDSNIKVISRFYLSLLLLFANNYLFYIVYIVNTNIKFLL